VTQRKSMISIACLSSALLASHVRAGTISSTFDTGLEGWTGNAVQITYAPSGGSPGGFLQTNDLPSTSFLQAPGMFLGDLSQFDGGSLSFGIRIFSTELPSAGHGGDVTLRSGATAVTRNVIDVPSLPVPSGWTNGSIALTASAWGLDQSAWSQLLANLTAIEIVVDPSLGGNNLDVSGFDNFRLESVSNSSVPEPATLSMLGAGLGTLIITTKLEWAKHRIGKWLTHTPKIG